MAHAWELNQSIVGFNLDYPEEVILIHHFVIAFAAQQNDDLLKQFTHKFFEEGKGVSALDFDHIIELAKKVSTSCEGLKLRPSGKTEYIATRDKAKAELRKEIRHKLDLRNGAEMLETAYRQLESLPMILEHDQASQRALFDRYRGKSDSVNMDANPLTPDEVKRRKQALRADIQSQQVSPRSEPTGEGDQPDLTGVDVLKHMNLKEDTPTSVGPEQQNMPTSPQPSSRDVLLGIRQDLATLNRSVLSLLEAIQSQKQH